MSDALEVRARSYSPGLEAYARRRGEAQAFVHPDSLNLARRPLRDVVDDEDPTRNLERRKRLRDEILERSFIRLLSGIENDGCCDLFTEAYVGDAERDRLSHSRVEEQNVVDFTGCDLFPASVDDLLDPPAELQVTVDVEHSEIAGPKPPSHESRGSRLGIVRVAAEDALAADRDLANHTGLDLHSVASTIVIFKPVAVPTVPGRRLPGGSGLLAI